MSKVLHFYSPRGIFQIARSPKHIYVIERQGPGLLGVVIANGGGIVHRLDWRDHAVHMDEMKAHLQKFADAA